MSNHSDQSATIALYKRRTLPRIDLHLHGCGAADLQKAMCLGTITSHVSTQVLLGTERTLVPCRRSVTLLWHIDSQRTSSWLSCIPSQSTSSIWRLEVPLCTPTRVTSAGSCAVYSIYHCTFSHLQRLLRSRSTSSRQLLYFEHTINLHGDPHYGTEIGRIERAGSLL